MPLSRLERFLRRQKKKKKKKGLFGAIGVVVGGALPFLAPGVLGIPIGGFLTYGPLFVAGAIQKIAARKKLVEVKQVELH